MAGKRHIAPKEIFDFEYLGNERELDFNLVEEFLADVHKNDQPFCLYMCSHEPHTPWNKGNSKNYNPNDVKFLRFWVGTKETREAYCRYLAEIEYMDSEVGKALELLKKYDLKEETIFIFTSEQGNSFPFAKWTCYNVGLHSAFIARWPGNIKSGSISDCLIDYSDVVPTYLDIAKKHYRKAETDNKAKKIVYKYKYRPALELYDDLKDPYNQNNLIDNPELGAVKNRLQNTMDDWMVK